jgi:hypothetical protein
VSLGIEVEGRRLDLAPMLHAVFKQDRAGSTARRSTPSPTTPGLVQLDDGERIALPAERLKPWRARWSTSSTAPRPASRCRASTPRAWPTPSATAGRARLAASTWLERIRGAAQIKPVAAPGLRLELRPYQLEGLAWLQHLREHGLGGILADDMGLGKTAQTLAHLLTEKHAGRLAKPALVVLPTSLVFNWQREAERFAPELKVLSLRGSGRAEAFAKIPEHDVCLTTYPLLWRDREQLAAHAYHSLILDEAQTVKNAASQAAQVVRTLRPSTACASPARPSRTTWASCGASSTSCCPASSATARISPPAGAPHREARRHRAPRDPRPPHRPLHPAPAQGAGRHRAAAQDHRGAQRRARRPPARPLRDRARHHGPAHPRRDRRPRLRAQPDRHPRRPAQAAPGVLRPAPHQDRRRRQGEGARQARPADGHAPELVEGRKVLLFSQFTGMLA